MKKEKERRSMELKNINTSLLSLKKVIHELHKLSTKKSGRNAPLGHVPFKDSTLTTLLEPYMLPDSNGQSHILMLLCCSTKQRDFFETVSTLRLGQEAADIQPSACLASLPYLQSQRLRAEEQELLQLLKENKQKRGLSGRRSSSVDIRKTQPSTAADGAERKFARTASAPLPPRRPSDIEISRKEQDQIQF
ncbi:hypothetical protein AGDE_13843 [Angomonas deanei]|uniref:Kinesin motor domain containing protein, putative n=1 Tax=Angomonas deanei TaxID=59799 RepID=A0A7G2CNK9_9TRYP|nr:hypothetical protein AGDE_13843 [Angomonas deanei]CAD2220521.1 Kinesin motor domain containing protein, putative [Angomonas deanei]|eukprot:EPY21710.1 hypothetical protein AGDE_13843 [Angomonas deanei]